MCVYIKSHPIEACNIRDFVNSDGNVSGLRKPHCHSSRCVFCVEFANLSYLSPFLIGRLLEVR